MYFGNGVTTIATLLVVLELCLVVHMFIKRNTITHWGRRTLAVGVLGLVVCCFVATRDGYHLSVQSTFDETVQAGLFTIDSVQSNLCCIGGGLIILAGVSSIFVKKQNYRKIMCFLLSGTVLLKTLIIEISRVIIM